MTTVALLAFLFLAQGLTPEVIEHARAGAEALKQGHFDAAIQEFRNVTASQPDSASGHANLGEAYFQNHDYAAAIPELQRALQLNPQMMGTHQTLGVALLVEGNATDAIPHLEKVRTPELLGLAYLEAGRLGSAIMALHASLERQPDDSDLLYYFGRATGLASKRTFEQLAKTNPAKGRRDAAALGGSGPVQDVVALQTALAKQPNDPDLLLAFSRAAAAASAQAFDKIVATDTGSARAHQVAAERYAEAGRLADAEKEYVESVRLKPYTSGVHLALGNVLAAEGNWPGAIAQFVAEAGLRPASADANYRLGSALLHEGRVKEALAAISLADRIQPNTPQILLAMGRAALAAKDAARAEQTWMKLLELDPRSDIAAQAHFGLAELYRDAGKSSEAEREMSAYRELKAPQGN